MKFNCQKTLKAALSCIALFLFLSCSNDLLDETEDFQVIKYQAKTSQTVTLTPIHAAFMQGSRSYNSSIIRLEQNNRTGYLMFDLSKIDGDITAASLEFTISSDPGYGTIEAHLGNGSNWTETNLTTNNRPSSEGLLGSINKSYTLGSTQKISLNSDSFSAEKTSLILLHKNGNDLAFASKQTSAAPKLIVTYSSSSSTSQVSKPGAVTKGYYVTVNGKSTNNGLSEGSAWDLKHAFKVAKAGDIVYVKAGNYGGLELFVSNSGTANNPIKFIGYKKRPGDISSTNGPTYSYEKYKANRNNLDSAEMPLLQKKRVNNIGSGIAIRNYKRDYIHIENFMIMHYEHGIYSQGNNSTFKNIISSDHGDFYIGNSYQNGTNKLHKNLTGNGFWITGSNNVEMMDCLSINNGVRGISLVATNNSIFNNNKVYSDNNINPTDYYILVYSSNHNKFNNNFVKRVGNLTHIGHGITLKVNSQYNTFDNCRAEGTSFELNNRISFNTFTNCHVEGQGIGRSGGWKITNYSHDNKFINCSNNAGEGIVFADWKESDGNNGINTAAFNNVFKNCTITNVVTHSRGIINFHYNDQTGRTSSYAKNNEFINCTFSGADFLFTVDRVNSGNKFINCNISNVKALRDSRYSINKRLSLGVKFTNTKTNNIGFSLNGI